MSTTILPQGKHVERTEDSDYAAYYDGMILGWRVTRIEAQELANQHVWSLLTKGVTVPAGELGGEE